MGVNGSSAAAHLETVRSRSPGVSLPAPYEQWFSLLRASSLCTEEQVGCLKSREMREPAKKEKPAEQGRFSRLLQKSSAHDHCETAGGQLTSESCPAHCPIQPWGRSRRREEDMTGRRKKWFPGKASKGVRTRWKGSGGPQRPAGGVDEGSRAWRGVHTPPRRMDTP